MKFVVDEMPAYADDCLFCEDRWNYHVCRVHSTVMKCPYFSPEWDCEPECPFLISLKEVQNKS